MKLVCLLLCVTFLSLTSSAEVSFTNDVRPILSKYCFHCHGPDAEHREAKLRLDTKEGLFTPKKKRFPVIAGKAHESEVFKRMITDDEDDIMPPPESKKEMSKEEIEIIRQWIQEGAPYEDHWAFIPPKKHNPPHILQVNSPNNFIDNFVFDKLAENGMTPSEPASKETLIRRLSLDLTGLPPTLSEIDQFIHDKSSKAYEKVVDRLLSSSSHAERLTLDWLDAARYADTNGYSIDDHRDMWAWRDWVIHAFMNNMPYDQFMKEQLAGDLLADATDQQKVATGFLRNSMNTHEGGTIAEEYRVQYNVDKVDTMSTIFLGLTVKCSQCHDHKYDPISQKNFYEVYAFFNNSSEGGKGAKNGNTKPFIEVNSILTSKEDMITAYKARIAELKKKKESINPNNIYRGFKGSLMLKSITEEIRVIEEQIKKGKTSVMVMDEKGNRDTFILDRGQYNKPADKVKAGVPEAILPFPEKAPKNRLGLVQWLQDEKHPLTARVAVNRFWQLIFGAGLVRTSEDFGNQGEVPSHPELLDTLAVDFRENGWNIRRLLKQIVMSSTYKQSSKVNKAYEEKDPYNRLLWRSPRYRLPAEFVRDNALSIAGILNPVIGGPSVYPVQPEGLWAQVSHYGHPTQFTAQSYYQSSQNNQVRKSIYTVVKRTAINPTMATFDAPLRETCTARRLATNTPLQSLTLLNDPQFVNAAKFLGQRMKAHSSNTKDRLTYAFRLATARKPSDLELKILSQSYEQQKAYYSENRDEALKLLQSENLTAEDAALTMLASSILNLSETVTRN